MEFGFNLPNGGPLAKPDTIAHIAARGEELGFTIFAIPDHIVFPNDIHSRYPYTTDGSYVYAQNEGGDVLEPLATIAYLAGITKKAKLLLSVLVVPYRHPVLTAKLLSTTDLLSKGRVVAGIGVGWMEQEFPPVGAPPFAERGKVTDEYIAVYRELWSNETPSFKGKYVEFDNIIFSPRPVQKGGIPIWVGGESVPALRRTARLGDAWFPIICNPKYPMNTEERFKARLDMMHGFAEAEKRDPSTIDISSWVVYGESRERKKTEDGAHELFTGSADDLAADIELMRKFGVSSLLFNFYRGELQKSLDAMAWFSEEVMPKVKR